MKMRMKPAVVAIFCCLLLSIGLSFIGWMMYESSQTFKESQRVVKVKGIAEEMVKSDLAVWKIEYKTSGTQLQDLYKHFSTQGQTILTFLSEQGFINQEVEVQAPNVIDTHQNEYRHTETLSPERFIAQGTVVIRTPKVEMVQKAYTEIYHIIEKGIVLTASPPRFFFTRLTDLRLAMISKATLSAKEMADQFAKDAGAIIGGIKTANQGVFEIINPDSGESGYYESAQSVMKKIRVVSSFDFFLE